MFILKIFQTLLALLQSWTSGITFWDEIKYKNDLPDSISATLKRVDALAFPNTYLALKLLGTLPTLKQLVNVRGHSHPLGVLRHGTEAQ